MVHPSGATLQALEGGPLWLGITGTVRSLVIPSSWWICEESPGPSAQGGHWGVDVPSPAPVRATAVPQFLQVKCGSGVGGGVHGGGQGPWRVRGGVLSCCLEGTAETEQHLPRKAGCEPSDRCSRGRGWCGPAAGQGSKGSSRRPAKWAICRGNDDRVTAASPCFLIC